MKRFHIHVGVKDLEKSVQFYSTLFGQEPTKLKQDYAKWMLDDPRINFAISTRSKEVGVDHLGIQVDEDIELQEITERLKKSDLSVYAEGITTCCYAESNKAWLKDPAGIAWEAYKNMAEAEVYGLKPLSGESAASPCCGPSKQKTSCC